MKDNRFEFIKGLAVTFVILLHTISDKGLHLIGHNFHIGQAVPLFILVTFIVSFMSLEKRESNECSYWYSKSRFWTMIKKICVPYYLMQVSLWAIQSAWHRELIPFGISGQGPGSYYPWVYLQFWLTMPLFFLILRKPKGIVWGGRLSENLK